MKLTKSMIPLAVMSALGLGFANQASASVYGVSTLEINNLSIVVSPAAGATIRNFNYNLTNTAFLNGVGGATNATCSGTPGLGGTTNNCGGLIALDAPVYNAPGSTVVAAENSFALQGPGANQYSRADSVIYDSQLTLDAVTHQQQIAESELQSGTSASAASVIQSVTGFTFTFTVEQPGSLTLSFDASAYLEASSNDPNGTNQAAQANIALIGSLARDSGGYLWQWTPDGTVNTNCIAAGAGASCTETADADAIGSNSVGVSTDPASDIFTTSGFGSYSVTFNGLTAGDHTFTLRSETSTNLSRTPAVPEPEIMLLLGIALTGFSLNMRRNRKSIAA
ncbi:MAG: PEP-CTERM sorting domain-containing protein [Methylovulum sp.]|nr:PEP-CTERM sorting domain-containing protein [Methylovulum sp.]